VVVGEVRQRNPAVPPRPECYMPYRSLTVRRNASVAKIGSCTWRSTAQHRSTIPASHHLIVNWFEEIKRIAPGSS
jgi:hypothetical protein